MFYRFDVYVDVDVAVAGTVVGGVPVVSVVSVVGVAAAAVVVCGISVGGASVATSAATVVDVVVKPIPN